MDVNNLRPLPLPLTPMTPLTKVQDFSICAERLTAKTASWHQNAVTHWEHENETRRESITSVSQAFGYELLARVGNVLLLPAALIDAICHVVVGAFTLLAAIPEKLYLLKQSRSEQVVEGEEQIANYVRKFTFGGACSNFESAVKYVGVAIFGTIAGVLFDPQAAANMAKAGQGREIADLLIQLTNLQEEKVRLEEQGGVDSEDSEAERQKDELNNARTANADLTRQIEQQLVQLNAAQMRITNQNRDIQTANTRVRTLEGTIRQLEEDKLKAEQVLISAQNSLKDASGKSEKTISDLNDQILALKNQILDLGKQIQILKGPEKLETLIVNLNPTGSDDSKIEEKEKEKNEVVNSSPSLSGSDGSKNRRDSS